MSGVHTPYLLLFLGLSILPLFSCSSASNDNGADIGNLSEADSNFVEYYAAQSIITEPGEYAHLFDGISFDIDQIVKAVHGVMISLDHVELEGINISKRRKDREVNIRKVKDILNRICEMDGQPITISRPPEKRMIGICSHFAILTCSILRHKGLPARTRGGFETYHSPTAHHDHSICEYWNVSEQRWVQIDSEIDSFLRQKWQVDFDCLDLPPGTFMTGVEAWKLCRAGKQDPRHFGILGDRWYGGWDFILNELVLDFMALNKTELLPWDGNELSEKGINGLTDSDYTLLDNVALLATGGNTVFAELRALYKSNPDLPMSAKWKL